MTQTILLVKKLSIIIPNYNEEKTIFQVLEKIEKLELHGNPSKEILVIDDHSSDNSWNEIQRFAQTCACPIKIHRQDVNQGKGGAIHKGVELSSGDYIVIQDADLELNPSDINILLEKLNDTPGQVIYGSRFLTKDYQNTNWLWHIMGNGFLTKLSNLFTRFKLTDMMTCYKLIPSETFKSLDLKEKRFGFEPEVTVKLSRFSKLSITEVSISYDARTKNDGKKINYKDGLRVIYCVIRYRLIR